MSTNSVTYLLYQLPRNMSVLFKKMIYIQVKILFVKTIKTNIIFLANIYIQTIVIKYIVFNNYYKLGLFFHHRN